MPPHSSGVASEVLCSLLPTGIALSCLESELTKPAGVGATNGRTDASPTRAVVSSVMLPLGEQGAGEHKHFHKPGSGAK